MAATGRNTLVTDYITALIAEADDTTYPNLADMDSDQIKYSIGQESNIAAVIIKNGIHAVLGLRETDLKDQTIGTHQLVHQRVFLGLFIMGVDHEADQKKAVTVAEEFELWMYANRRASTLWWMKGKRRSIPDRWPQSDGQIIRSYYMDFNFEKLGTAGL